MPRPFIPKSPLSLAFVLWRIWRRLPPAQRRQMFSLARRHAPRLAALFARRAMPVMGRRRR